LILSASIPNIATRVSINRFLSCVHTQAII
jgi:hypothetical protein